MLRRTVSSFATRQINIQRASAANAATKHLFSTATKSSSYVSPYNDLFAMMKKSNSPSNTIAASPERVIPKLNCGVSESVLKFRTTCYDRLILAPYVQASEYRVILQVNMKHLPLESDLEKEIFHQIVGTRFDHDLNELKLTSNQFASRIENKRHLCWMLDRIVMGSKKLAEETN